MKKQDIQRIHYNKISQEYVRTRLNPITKAYRDCLWEEFLKMISEEIPKKKKILCLDAMCGNAEASNRLTILSSNIVFEAFDYSDEMVRISMNDELVKDGRLKVKQMDILNLKVKERYDLVVLIGGIHHIYESAQEVINKIYNSLKFNGIFVNFEPTNNLEIIGKIREFIYKRNSVFEENSEHDFRLGDYNKMITNVGFKIESQFYPGLLGYVLFYNPDAFPLFLKIGSSSLVRCLCFLDIFFGKSFVGKCFSFNTFTISRK